VDATSAKAERAAEFAALPLEERLKRRIIDGERNGLEGDLELALAERSALEIVNQILLDGMKTVGELFGSGQMQLPFVLQSAEVMKASVGYLEPHMEKSAEGGRGRIVLATVRGDVHDIGKNLVDIILSNNGYDVVNIGIKQPISAIIAAAEEHNADIIGMSGLLVKSTVVMRDNLAELNDRGLAGRWPVLLGGAALTRAFVEQDLAELFAGEVRYARDAFEGLHLMDAVMSVKRGVPGAALPPLRARRVKARAALGGTATSDVSGGATVAAESGTQAAAPDTARARTVSADNPIPRPPFWGTRIIKGIPLADYSAYLDERATFMGQWGLKPSRKQDGPSYEDLVESEGRPRLRMWLERAQTEGLLQAAVVYGYFPCVSDGNDLIILSEAGEERERFTFPRQQRDERLCLADYFRPASSGDTDVVAFQLATMGSAVSGATAELFAANAYREYLELHGLSVQLTEALAEYWHARVRKELTIASEDPADLDGFFSVKYQGARYSIGYPACPDLADRAKIARLLQPERIGVELSEEMQLHPEQSTDAIVIHHPAARYFSV
jgi:5-methyltetrahydrofolate--homocysteine methyltransferase